MMSTSFLIRRAKWLLTGETYLAGLWDKLRPDWARQQWASSSKPVPVVGPDPLLLVHLQLQALLLLLQQLQADVALLRAEALHGTDDIVTRPEQSLQ